MEEMSFRGILIGILSGFILIYLLSHGALGSWLSPTVIWRILFLGMPHSRCWLRPLHGAGSPSLYRPVVKTFERQQPAPLDNQKLEEKNGVSPDHCFSLFEL